MRQSAIVGICALRIESQATRHGTAAMARRVAPAVLIVMSGGLLLQLLVDTPSSVFASLAIVAVGVAYYYAMIHPRRMERWTLPEAIRVDSVEEEAKRPSSQLA